MRRYNAHLRRSSYWLLMRSGMGWLVEVSSGGDRDDEDGGEEPVDGRAEGGPSSCVGDVLAVLLPGIFEPVAGVAEHEQPGGRSDGG